MSIHFSELKYNLYELLNVDISASKSEIENKYRKIIKKFHPDKKKLSELEEEIYYEITLGYHILTNNKRREQYNLYLTRHNRGIQNEEYDNTTFNDFHNDRLNAHKQFLKNSNNLLKRKKKKEEILK